jgi:hypothetical protein
MTIHNSSSSTKLVLGPIQTLGVPISSPRLPDWKMEMQELEEGMTTRDNNCRPILLAVPTVNQRLQGTGFYPPIR